MLNTDGTFSSDLNVGEVGGVFHNSNRDWLLWFTATSPHVTPAEVKVYALFKGLQIAVEQHLQPLELMWMLTSK